MHKKIKWQQRRKKKKVSKKLKRFLMKNKLDSIYKALVYSDSSNNYFDFSNSTEGKIGYLKGSRIPSNSHLLFDKDYRTSMGYHATVGKLVSSSEHTDNWQIQKASALLYVESELKDNEMFLTPRIAHYYLNDNYTKTARSGGLYGSCMRESWCQDAIRLYESFGKSQVELLVLLDDDGLVMGRALFWKQVHKYNGKVTEYLDRVYAINDNVAQAFYSWAERRGCPCYDKNGIDGDVHVDISYDDAVPYFDTFVSYTDGQGITSGSGDYCLQETSCEPLGGSSHICEHCGARYDPDCDGAYTEDTNQNVCGDCYRFCEDGHYYLIDNCVRVNRSWYHNEDENIIYSEYDSTYYHIDNTVYSEYHNSSLHIDDTVEDSETNEWYHCDDVGDVLHEVNDKYFHKDSDAIVEIDGDYYEKDYDDVVEVNDVWFLMDSDDIVEIEGEYYEKCDEVVVEIETNVYKDGIVTGINKEYFHIDSEDIVNVMGQWFKKDSNKIFFDEGDLEYKLRQYQLC